MKQLILIVSLFAFTLTAQAQQCKGIKKDGTQCQIKGNLVGKDEYCNHHSPTANKCTQIKKDGTRCKMTVKDGVLFCRFHAKA